MAYRVLYREWRPQDFRSLVGQNHISQTLQNAINMGRIAHAYLFAGPRGTGKTSTAKIMAKAVNCLALSDGQPCNACLNCENINSGRSMDVMEIDAASNRGIDEIRELRERVGFVPSQGKYKVYIIDEVHMLTTEAFNALLKTLEEPPAHVIFILATTEPQKIPATILSRCQRFDFRRISPRQMEERLGEILEATGLTAEEGVLSLIVKKAEGGLRDAISILDQCMSFSHSNITLQTAHEVMGLVKSEALTALLDSLIAKDAANLLVQVNAMLKEGIEAGQILRDLTEHLRSMILLLVCGVESQLVAAGSDEKEVLFKQARQLGLPWLSRAVSLLAKIESESRWRQNMRIMVETTLLSLILTAENEGGTDHTAGRKSGKKEPVRKTGTDGKAGTDGAEGTAAKPVVEKGKKETDTADGDDVREDIRRKEQNGKYSAAPPGNSDTARKTDADGKTDTAGKMEEAEIKDKWSRVMERVKSGKKTLHAFLTECEPVPGQEGDLVLVFKSGYTFHKEKVEEPGNRKLLEEVLEQVYDRRMSFRCALEKENDNTRYDPVQKAIDLFGAELVRFKD